LKQAFGQEFFTC